MDHCTVIIDMHAVYLSHFSFVKNVSIYIKRFLVVRFIVYNIYGVV